MSARAVAAAWCVWTAVSALAYEPRLNRLEPQGGQRGTEVAVDLVGPRIGVDPQEIVFYEPGIEVTALDRVDNNRVKAKLAISPECRLGRHAMRVRTASGLSELRTFHVGALQELAEAEPNNELGAAQPAPLDSVINGVVEREDVDVFQVKAREGERLSVEVEGLRLGRTFFDPLVQVLSESGDVVAECDDVSAARQDAFVSLMVPATGKYYVRVRESAFRGGNAASYRLHVGRFPRPTAVFPPAGVAGQEATVTWIGDATGDMVQTIDLPGSGDVYEARASDDAGVALTPLRVKLVDAPPVIEREPNDSRSKPTDFSAPGVVAGVIAEHGDRDHYRFTAKKNQVLELRVLARSLRSPLDSVLRVKNSEGRNLAGNDDDRGEPDSYIRFKAPEDGQYVLQVEDRLRRGREDFVYLVEAKPPEPVAELSIDERRRYEATVIEVPRGGRAAVLVTVARRNFGGQLDLTFADLPAGVSARLHPLAGNYNRVPVIFTAAEDAPLDAALSPVEAKLTDAEREVQSRFEQQTWLVRGRNNRPVWSHFARRAPVVVTEPLPFRLRLQEPKSPLVRGGRKNLKVVAERDEGFEQGVRIYTLYNPPGVSSNRSRSVRKGETEAVIPATANGNARLGDWNITVVGELNQGGRVYTCTQFVTLTVAEPYFDMELPTLTATQGDAIEMTVELAHRTPFEGGAKLELIRLPPGVTSTPVEVTKENSTAVFPLKVAADAKPGRHRGVACRARLTVNHEPVVYTQGYVELRVDPRRPAANAAARVESQSSGGES